MLSGHLEAEPRYAFAGPCFTAFPQRRNAAPLSMMEGNSSSRQTAMNQKKAGLKARFFRQTTSRLALLLLLLLLHLLHTLLHLTLLFLHFLLQLGALLFGHHRFHLSLQ